MSNDLKTSPLDAVHRDLGARMVPFAGWEMPVMYDSIITEHQAVRGSCGVFDISHMGQFFVRGRKAEEWLDRMLTNDVKALGKGEAHYTFLLNEEGGVIDDLILYCLDEGSYLMVVNAACLAVDLDWLTKHLVEGVELIDESTQWAGLAVQGAKAPEVYTAITEGRTLPARNGVDKIQHEGSDYLVCRTGYTGEDGFELFCSARKAKIWWEALMEQGVKPCGLGSRDSLRLEMCYPLNGNDLTPTRTPIEAGLGFFVSLEKEEFIGGAVLRAQKHEGVAERLMAIEVTEKGAPPRPGYPVVGSDGTALGTLSSGGLSPSLGVGIALAYLPNELKVGRELFIEVRGRKIPAKIVKKPFYRK